VAPITSKIRDIPSEVFLSEIENSMKNDCAVNCDHIQTVSKGKVGALITSISKREMTQAGKAIEFAFDL